ncbi:hypothetical protein AGOR_G00000630 [Albula goreensis]|uniref:Uncharacterized protein n=1 Tax=Albula goreensis TaxID=1534307 RepID=A0A8T3EA07_9TELE|nr:hypothetical protein AGOR_G00000630 [Albula goreensis]
MKYIPAINGPIYNRETLNAQEPRSWRDRPETALWPVLKRGGSIGYRGALAALRRSPDIYKGAGRTDRKADVLRRRSAGSKGNAGSGIRAGDCEDGLGDRRPASLTRTREQHMCFYFQQSLDWRVEGNLII